MEQNNQAAVIAVIEYVNVYANGVLRIGDEVIMNMDKEARGWGRKGPADGTKGTVMGFWEYFTTENYNQGFCKPGIYRGNGAALVKWETGEVDFDQHDLAIPKDLYEERKKDTAYVNAFTEKVKVFDLPNFRFMVGNKVAVTNYDMENGTITAIDFEDIINLRTGELKPEEAWRKNHIIKVDFDKGGTVRVAASDLVFLEYGNYWAYLNDKSELKFKDLQEEARFYRSLGKVTQLMNPATEDYSWTIEQAVEAVRKGEADLIGTAGSFFGSTPFPIVFKFDEDLADLAARCRAEIIKGFAQAA